MNRGDYFIIFLTKNGAMCDRCLAKKTATKPRHAVTIYCRELERDGRLIREQRECLYCHQVVAVNRPA